MSHLCTLSWRRCQKAMGQTRQWNGLSPVWLRSVAVQRGLLGEGPGAQVALLRALACVDVQIGDQVALVHKGLDTVIALVGGARLCVCASVSSVFPRTASPTADDLVGGHAVPSSLAGK